MSVKFRDYYEILGLSKDSKPADIKKAYRKLARKYHPDISKEKDAEEKFKELSEAYEVLSDPDKRSKYDSLGHNWKNGQDFQAPPGSGDFHYEYHGPGSHRSYTFDDMGGGFSDFFESLFGNAGGRTGESHRKNTRGGTGVPPINGQNHEANIEISLDEAYSGTQTRLKYQATEVDANGTVKPVLKDFETRIPAGVTEGTLIRLKGKGGQGYNGGKTGDLYLRIHLKNDHRFTVNKHNLETEVKITPWDAALGTTLSIPTLKGKTSIKLKAGIQSGQKLRVKDKGLPLGKDKGFGDLIVAIKIVVPEKLSEQEKELFEKLKQVSTFKPV